MGIHVCISQEQNYYFSKGRYLVVGAIMSFLAWRKDKGTFIRAATGNLISWSSFLSRAGVHSQAPLPALSLQGQAWGTMGGTWMELALIYTITLASVFI